MSSTNRLYLTARDGGRPHASARKHTTSNSARRIADAYAPAEQAAKSGQYGMQILDRLWRAILENDQVAAHALIRHAQCELGATVQMASNVAALLAPPKSKA